MYKLLIVDDEEIIRKGLKVIIDGFDMDFSEVIEAENGIKALECIETYAPDIIISDIKMPHMDGLQLLKVLKEKNLSSRIILLTGYSDFEYAKQAISYKALDYLLKPVKEPELYQVLWKAVEDLKKEKERETFIANQSKTLKNVVSDLTEMKLKEILLDPNGRKNNFSSFIMTEGISMNYKNFIVFYGQISSNSVNGYSSTIKDWKEIVKSNLSKKFKNMLISADSMNKMTAIINFNEDYKQKDIEEVLKNLSNILLLDGLKMSWGISKKSQAADDVPNLFIQSRNALKEKILYGPGKMFFYEALQPDSGYAFTETEIIKVVSLLETSNFDKLFEYFRLKFDEPVRKQIVRGKSFENSLNGLLLNVASRLKGEENINSLINNDYKDFVEQMSSCTNMYDAIRLYVETLLRIFADKYSGINHPNLKKPVDCAKIFIQKNYYKDINLNMIANYVSMNSSYFSVLFKKETGMSLIDFINEIRIGKALEYLNDQQYKVYEIAEKVGFRDEKYFSKVFKKNVDMTPTQYREKKV